MGGDATLVNQWPLAVFGALVSVAVGTSALIGSTQPIGGGWVVLWVTVFGVGSVIMSRVPDNSVGRLMFAYGVMAMLSGYTLGLLVVVSPDHVPWYEPLAVALNSAALSLVGINAIFTKLDLLPERESNRRVRAVLAYLSELA